MIVNDTDILRVIRDIETEYNRTLATHYAILYSKLAIIEFCGWIEQTFDEILKQYIHSKLAIPNNINYVETNIIKRNNGFHYDNNFRKMLLNIIGVSKLENLEDFLENSGSLLTQLKPILEMFTTERNKAAHTYTPYGATITYQTPSIVLSKISILTPILQKIEQEIMRY